MSKARIVPFLSFTGQAEAAMRFYAQVLPETSITTLVRYGIDNPHMPAEQGDRIMYGAINCMGQEIMFLDMSDEYPAPPFNWAHSLYIDCQNEAEFDEIFQGLSEEGSIMMGPESVGDIRKCAWVVDKFGVTWQPVWA
ncbi:hypothetical protein DOK78_000820 [Enterococcus sp. DIV2402]|uniref:PhnB-like domain-containing protein n=1 Tax=Candidatus Enterococcus lowellii TaxID=2230877 RepID=A0ABZ2SPS4_9ENTE|nr:VOC family protein [Enterococcus sp. DIV2402]MBO0465848.1 VOC family protein [Enterococcus sp. DIV2402]